MSVNQKFNSRAVLSSILWGIIIPQAFLVALNVRSWTLISGESNKDEAYYALAILAIEIILIVIATAIVWLQVTKRTQVGWKTALSSLLVHAIYMWFFIFNVGNIIPDSIQPWILNEENVGRWNITLFMPGAFLSLYALSGLFFSKFKGVKGRAIVLLATIGMPVAWYLLASLMQPAWLGQISVVISVLIGTVMVVVFLGSLIHLFDNIIHKSSTKALVEKHYIIAVLVGLAAPLGGLVLNQTIPFPADFQSNAVYVLTVINGFVLLIKPEGHRYTAIKLFLRCVVFPFIVYFFLVFLPFLPLSLLAIVIAGAGFLMLTPLVLGLFQARVTLNEYTLAKTKLGAPKAIVIGVLGLSVLPAYFLVQAGVDKNALNTSVEYFYSHDTSSEVLTESQISRSAKALVQLRDRKAGIQLPYISGIYNAVVFGDLVLSDKKISRMHKLLTGIELPKQNESMFGSRDHSRRSFERRFGNVAPTQDVEIKKLTLNEQSNGKSTVSLILKNNTDDTHSLFVDQLDIPEGVFVTGLRLKIEQEWVSGRVFDKKTALWVFQKITEVRRDPALLYYLSAKKAELRVYPFPRMGIREVEIDFQYHPNIDSKIAIGGQEINLNPRFDAVSVVSESGKTVINENISELAFQRTPYVHFILDFSLKANVSDREYAEKINKVRAELNIDDFRVTAANIAVSKNHTAELLNTTNVEDVIKHISTIKLPKAGGLWLQQAIAKEIVRVKETINQESLYRTPVFVVISNQKLVSDVNLELDPWSWLIPDLKGWYSYSAENLQMHAFQNRWHEKGKNSAIFSPVIAIKQGSDISILPADTSSIFDTSKGGKLSIYNHIQGVFSPLALDVETSVDSQWATYAESWINWKNVNLNPSELELHRNALLKKSRTQNLLLPVSSLIVVESSSQWEILKRKEKQSLNNHSALDFEEQQQTSEPSWWLLLLGLLIFIYFREKKEIEVK